MTTTTTTARSAPPASRTRLRTLGRLTVVTGVIGAAQAAVILAWPDQVSDRYDSYPFDPTGRVVAQASLEAERPTWRAPRSTADQLSERSARPLRRFWQP